MKPTKADIKKWAAALRSGNYRQTKYSLHDENGFCCLGVACDVFIPKKRQILNASGRLVGGMPSSQVNAPKWLKKVNLNVFDKLKSDLVYLNDGKSLTFDEIADVLEAVYIHDALEEDNNG